MLEARRLSATALLFVPAGLLLFFAFNSGGYPAGPRAYAAALLCLLVALRAAVARDPLAGGSRRLAVAVGALALYAVLELVSGGWSHAPGAARVAFDLPLLYALAMLLCGSVGQAEGRLAWMLRGVAVAVVFVCACGLITRVLPRVWPTPPSVAVHQLSFPVSYWNTLGLLAAVGIVLCVHLSSESGEAPLVRALAAAAAPVLVCTLYFTFSRGAAAICVIALIVYVLAAHRPGVLSALIVVIPLSAVALTVAYDANLLAGVHPTSAAAVVQGRHVAIAVGVCVVLSGVLRAMLSRRLDGRLARTRWSISMRGRRGVIAALALATLAAVAVIALSGRIAHDYHRFLQPTASGNVGDLRTRLSDPANGVRVAVWKVAWRQFEAAPLLGHGADTFPDAWARYRPALWEARAAHSLYLQTLAELGIVGLILLLTAMVTVLLSAASGLRGPTRCSHAAVLAVALAIALHAAFDWDWEMPVVMVLFFSLGGFVAGRHPSRPERERVGPARRGRVLLRGGVAVSFLALSLLPAYVWLSQRNLDSATYAFSKGDCLSARDAAAASISRLGDRAEPYEILAYCDVRLGEPVAGWAAARRAVALEPRNWTYRYALAVTAAAAGQDPRPAAAGAWALNPLEPRVRFAWLAFQSSARARWTVWAAFFARASPL